MMREADLRAVRDVIYISEQVKYSAGVLANNFIVTLSEHLGDQPCIAVNMRKPQFHDAITRAFEEALSLKAECSAAGQDTPCWWVPPGAKAELDSRTMALASHQFGSDADYDRQVVALCFWPRMKTQIYSGQYVDACPARVKVYLLPQEAEVVSNSQVSDL